MDQAVGFVTTARQVEFARRQWNIFVSPAPFKTRRVEALYHLLQTMSDLGFQDGVQIFMAMEKLKWSMPLR